jgi:hypothetical protein
MIIPYIFITPLAIVPDEKLKLMSSIFAVIGKFPLART